MAAVTFSLEEKERRSLSQQIAYWIERELEKEASAEAASVDAAEVA